MNERDLTNLISFCDMLQVHELSTISPHHRELLLVMSSLARAREGVRGSLAASDWLGRSSVTRSAAGERRGHDADRTPDDNGPRLILTLTGWRRRCLFGLLLVLTVIVIINLSLTLWLLRAMQFSLVNSNSIGLKYLFRSV